MPTKAELHQAAKEATSKKTRVVTVQITVSIPIGLDYSDNDIIDLLKIKSVIPEIKVLGAVSND